MKFILTLSVLCLSIFLYGQEDTLNFALFNPKPGPYKEYYKSGKLKLEGNFTQLDSIECIGCYNSSQNKKISKANSHIMRTGEWKEYHENGQLKSIGTYKGIHETLIIEWPKDYEKKTGMDRWVPGTYTEDYLKDNTWKYYNDSGQLIRVEFYFKGMLADVIKYER